MTQTQGPRHAATVCKAGAARNHYPVAIFFFVISGAQKESGVATQSCFDGSGWHRRGNQGRALAGAECETRSSGGHCGLPQGRGNRATGHMFTRRAGRRGLKARAFSSKVQHRHSRRLEGTQGSKITGRTVNHQARRHVAGGRWLCRSLGKLVAELAERIGAVTLPVYPVRALFRFQRLLDSIAGQGRAGFFANRLRDEGATSRDSRGSGERTASGGTVRISGLFPTASRGRGRRDAGSFRWGDRGQFPRGGRYFQGDVSGGGLRAGLADPDGPTGHGATALLKHPSISNSGHGPLGWTMAWARPACRLADTCCPARQKPDIRTASATSASPLRSSVR